MTCWFWCGRLLQVVLSTLLVIGGVEQNPGPESLEELVRSLAGKKIMTWNRDNVSWAFVAAQLGAESATFQKRTAAVLKSCVMSSLAARQVIKVYSQILECRADMELFNARWGKYCEIVAVTSISYDQARWEALVGKITTSIPQSPELILTG